MCPQGALVGVCGAVGSGKSSLLSALLGQVRDHTAHQRHFLLWSLVWNAPLTLWPLWKAELCTQGKWSRKKVLCTDLQDIALEIRMGQAVWDTKLIFSTTSFSFLYRWPYSGDQWRRTGALPMLLSRPGSSTVPWGRTFCSGKII